VTENKIENYFKEIAEIGNFFLEKEKEGKIITLKTRKTGYRVLIYNWYLRKGTEYRQYDGLINSWILCDGLIKTKLGRKILTEKIRKTEKELLSE
jgi:hypothetical protein